MLNGEGSHPEYFEELCALAASGQISEPELIELKDHMQQCAHCRSVSADFIDLFHNKLPLMNPELMGSFKRIGLFSGESSYRERFLARARKEGLAVSDATSRDTLRTRLRIWLWPGLSYAQVATFTVAVLLVTVGLLAYKLHQINLRYTTLTSAKAGISAPFSPHGSPGPQESSSASPSLDRASPLTAALPPGPETGAELAKARTDRASAEERSKTLEEQLKTIASELEALRDRNDAVIGSREQVEKKLKEAEQVATTVKDDLQQIRQARSKDAVTIAVQELEMQKLSEKLTEQTEILERERTLLAAGRDIHDLMGARNLHIADVFDVDSKGKDQKAFGRIFYTEEKSLIFYAFDLSNRNTAKRNASFQVWGTRGPAQSPTQSLGIFYVDDQKQNRWVLKFEDPRILAEIDSVFVTIEPPGGSAKPTGRKFLYAYLNANPNHP
jgi:TolA-binding protein